MIIVYKMISVLSFMLIFESTQSFDQYFSYKNPNDKCLTRTNVCYKKSKLPFSNGCFGDNFPTDKLLANINNHLNINYWLPLKAIPRCWKSLKIFLCSIKYPICIRKSAKWLHFKIGKELCLNTLSECSLLIGNLNGQSLLKETPPFLRCDDYPSDCYSDISYFPTKKRTDNKKEVYNCQYPLVKTDKPQLWIPGINGCTFHCLPQNLSRAEYRTSRLFLGFLGVVFICANLFVIITFVLVKRHYTQHQLKFPPIIWLLCAIHFHLLIGCIGWANQIVPSIYKTILCDSNYAPRIRHPQTQIGDSLTCVTVFSLIYFSLISSSLTSFSLYYIIHSSLTNLLLTFDKSNSFNSSPTNQNIDQSPTANNLVTDKKFSLSLWGSTKRSKKNQSKLLFEMDEKNNIEKDKTSATDHLLPQIDGNEHNNYLLGEKLCDYVDKQSVRCKSQLTTSQIFLVLISAALLVVSLTIVEVGADPKSGICFIGSNSASLGTNYLSTTSRLLLSLLPLFVILVAKTYLFVKINQKLRRLKLNSNSIVFLSPFFYYNISNNNNIDYFKHLQHFKIEYSWAYFNKKFTRTIRYFGLTLTLLWLLCIFSIYTHIHLFLNEPIWKESMKQQFVCQVRNRLPYAADQYNMTNSLSQSISCPLLHRPSISTILMHNTSYFALNLVFLFFTLSGGTFWKIWHINIRQLWLWVHRKKTGNMKKNPKNQYFVQDLLLDGVWNPGLFLHLLPVDESKMKKISATEVVVQNHAAHQMNYQQNDYVSVSSSNVSVACRHHKHQKTSRFLTKTNNNTSSNNNNSTKNNDYGAHLLNMFFNNPEYDNSIPYGVHKSNSFAGRPQFSCNLSNNNKNRVSSIANAQCVNRNRNLSRPNSHNFSNCPPHFHFNSNAPAYSNSANGSLFDDGRVITQQNSNFSLHQQPAHSTPKPPIMTALKKIHQPSLISGTKKATTTTRRLSVTDPPINSLLPNNPGTGNSGTTDVDRRHSLRSAITAAEAASSKVHQRGHPQHQHHHYLHHQLAQQTTTNTTTGAVSCGCISSSQGGESYNSYNLMMEQQGGCWRDLCRTRMTIQDAMNWANFQQQQQQNDNSQNINSTNYAAYCPQCQQNTNLQINNQNFYPCCSLASPIQAVSNQNPSIHSSNKLAGTLVSSNNDEQVQILNLMQPEQQPLAVNVATSQNSHVSLSTSTGNKDPSTDSSSDSFDSEDDVVSMNLSEVINQD